MGIELSPDLGAAPEDVLILPGGEVLTGLEDGRLVRLPAGLSRFEVVADTGGRPLGLERYPGGRVLICDARRGLVLLDPETGALSAHAIDPPPFCNNAAVGQDGTVWFSSSSRRHPIEHSDRDVIEARPTGSLWRCDVDGHCTELAGGLYFANGVVLAPDESFVLVAESGSGRVLRHDLSGTAAGRTVPFLTLPALPDNLSVAPDGRIWVALVVPYQPVRTIWRLPFALRWLIARLPAPPQKRLLQVARFGFDGRMAPGVDMAGAAYHYVTGVREAEGWLYVASIAESCIARLPVPRN